VVADGVKQGNRALLVEHERQTLTGALFGGGPELGETVTRGLGAGLSCRFPLVLPSIGGHTWGPPGPPLPPLQQALASVDLATLDGADERLRLAAVIIAWNVYEHFYPFFDVISTDWDAVLTRSLSRALADRSHADFGRTLRWLVAQVQDGHGTVSDRRSPARGTLPWRLDFIEGQVVVTAAAPESRLLPGDVVLTIGGRPARTLLEETEGLVSGSPQWRRVSALERLVAGNPGAPIDVTFRRGEEVRSQRLRLAGERFVAPERRPRIDKLDSGVWYVNLDQAPWGEIAARLPELAAAPGVIFDLRGYPRNNHALIQHLLGEDDRSNAWMQVPQIARPDRERLVGHVKHAWLLPGWSPASGARSRSSPAPGPSATPSRSWASSSTTDWARSSASRQRAPTATQTASTCQAASG
jgi:hypothetical protein